MNMKIHQRQAAESGFWRVAGAGRVQVDDDSFRERRWVDDARERVYYNKRY